MIRRVINKIFLQNIFPESIFVFRIYYVQERVKVRTVHKQMYIIFCKFGFSNLFMFILNLIISFSNLHNNFRLLPTLLDTSQVSVYNIPRGF